MRLSDLLRPVGPRWCVYCQQRPAVDEYGGRCCSADCAARDAAEMQAFG